MSPTAFDYADLVQEARAFEFPSPRPRREVVEALPEPAPFNLIHAITGIRRCGKTFYAFQLIQQLLSRGVPRDRVFYFNFADDRLRPTSVRLNRAVLDACRIVIGILAESEQLAPDRNPDNEAHRLHALLDGLAMHGLWDGGTDAGRRALDILDQHLGELGAPPA